MKKRKLNITLITNGIHDEYNLLGEYDEVNKIITYNESNELLTEVKLNLKDKILTRENKDYYLEYKFIENEETENEIKLKELNQSISLKIKTSKFDINDNQLEIIYTILDSKEKVTYIVKF